MTRLACTGESFDEAEAACYQDAVWAMHDSETQRRFPGEWVVAYRRKVIAHGSDPDRVRSDASQPVAKVNHRLELCAASAGDGAFLESSDAPLGFASRLS